MTESVPSAAKTAASPGAASTPPKVVLGVVALDTNEPRRLADFYASLLGWEVMTQTEEDWIEVHPSSGSGSETTGSAGVGGAGLAFQLVINYVPPTWPTQDIPQQVHLDFDVTDLDEGEAFAVSLGAERVSGAGVPEHFRVFLDPSGHPFCLCSPGGAGADG